MEVGKRLKNAWNAFLGRDPTIFRGYGVSSGRNPSGMYLTIGTAKDIVGAICNQIAVDCSTIDMRHVRLDKEKRYAETIDDSLNQVLTVDANVDQTGRSLIRDAVISLLDEGVIAIVPFETDIDPENTESFQVLKARVGKILQWYPKHILVELYDEDSGIKKQLVLEKRICAIVENPFFLIMNSPNSVKQRLIRVSTLLDQSNTASASDSLDLIVQLPFSVHNKTKKKLAEDRLKDIEEQLVNSPRGIAYVDGSEKIIQLNRPLENNLWEQYKELTTQLYNTFGLTESIFNGTADEQTLLNYNNRTIEPIMSAIAEEMERKWLSKTARSQGQAIRFFKDPFKLVPVTQLAEIVDKFTRNEIATSNECRSFIGMKPSNDPKADQLRNSNLNHPDEKEATDNVVDEIVHSIMRYKVQRIY